MANNFERAAVGGVYRPLSARHHNALIDLAERYIQQQLGGPASPIDPRRATNLVIVKNATGAALSRGEVVQLGDLLNDAEPGGDVLIFEGLDPDPDGSDTIAILTHAVADTATIEAQLTGVVFCRLNVQHVQHKWADVDANDPVLQSRWHGRCEILWTSTATTGEQDAVVRIGQAFLGPIRAVVTETGGIAAGGSGEVTIKWGSGLASPASTETAWLTHMNGGADADEDADCDIYWDPSQQKYIIHALECSG